MHCLLFVVSKPDQIGEMDRSPDTAFPAQAAPPAPGQATPTVVVLTREVDIRKFYGDDSTRAKEFEEDIRRAWDAQPTLSSRRRLDLILSNVGPKVKAEVSCLETDVQTDPEQVLAAIIQSFGESRSSSMLLQALLMTTQRQGESVRDYSHRAKEAYDKLTSRQLTLGEVATQETVLRDHFAASLQDQTLVRYLRERLHAGEGLSFQEVRRTAMRWANDHGEGSAAVTVASQQTSGGAREDRLDRLEGLMMAVLERLNSQHLTQPRRGFNESGLPVCFHCGDESHRIRDCPQKKKQAGKAMSLQ